MSQYIVSARKYRPVSFGTLIGQDNIARTLKNSILRGQLAHAYLFCGPRGVGKTSTARIFAKTINCSNPTADMEPCGECESCLSFQEGRSYCIHELDAASNNGVDDIKNLMDKVQIPPQVGRYSVYIIDEVHMLSQSAFNAFLKTLEEPPAHAIFILATTEKHKIIPTVLSRCQTYDFNRISVADIVRNLRTISANESVTIDDESLHVIASKADGAMRDALTIFDQTVAFCGTDIKYQDVIRNLNVLDSEYGFRLVDDFLSGNYKDAFLTFDSILSKGFNALYFLSSLGSHLRDLLVSRTGGMESLLDRPDSVKARLLEQSQRCTVQFIFDALGIVTQCESGYRAASNQRLHIEFALMRLCFLLGVPGSEAKPTPKAEIPQTKAPEPVQATSAAKPAPAVAPAPTAAPEPAAAPVPTAAPEPAAAPAAPAPKKAAPRSPSKLGASLSLSSMMEESASSSTAAKDDHSADPLPTDEALREKWPELAARNSSQPRLASTLANATLYMTQEDDVKVVTFEVVNEAQKHWIEEKVLRSLETAYREILGTSKVRLAVGVTPDEQVEKKPYLPVEKARDLMSRNDDVRSLITDFELDVK